jgi:hypothetical protein
MKCEARMRQHQLQQSMMMEEVFEDMVCADDVMHVGSKISLPRVIISLTAAARGIWSFVESPDSFRRHAGHAHLNTWKHDGRRRTTATYLLEENILYDDLWKGVIQNYTELKGDLWKG